MALVTPALLVLMLVAAEFTRVFYEYNTLTKSVRDAARFLVDGAINPATRTYEIPASRVTMAKNLAVTGELTGGTPLLEGLSVDDIKIDTGVLHGAAPLEREHVEVTADYTFEPLSPVIDGMGFLSGDVGLNFTLRASSTMRAL